MKIFSWNINGLRAVTQKKDFADFIAQFSPDILFLQEIKCFAEQVQHLEEEFLEYEKFYHSAEKAGYSGTAIWIKKSFAKKAVFEKGMPNFVDNEGRIVRVDIEDFSIFGGYFPNGGKSSEAWTDKLKFYENFLAHIIDLRSHGKKIIFCGDVNCAHEKIDLARPEENDGKVGFHPEERKRISDFVEKNFVDVWRVQNPNTTHQYSWWTYRGGARERNVGWRIDYFFADSTLLPFLSPVQYHTEILGSDHCPVSVEMLK